MTNPEQVNIETLIAFLNGEGPLDGVWFGDTPAKERGPFFWRKYLRAFEEDLSTEEVRVATAEEALAQKILAELVRARTKFPGKNVTFAALVEEVGELATATFEENADRVEKEAVQVAVMAMRMVLDGDHCFDAWRREKGLDALGPVVCSAQPQATDIRKQFEAEMSTVADRQLAGGDDVEGAA